MSYGAFLLLFLATPLVLLGLFAHHVLHRSTYVALGVLALVAVVYTGPWDALLVSTGVWSYGSGRVLGLTVGGVPLEEYGFYILQVGVTGILTLALLAHDSRT